MKLTNKLIFKFKGTALRESMAFNHMLCCFRPKHLSVLSDFAPPGIPIGMHGMGTMGKLFIITCC